LTRARRLADETTLRRDCERIGGMDGVRLHVSQLCRLLLQNDHLVNLRTGAFSVPMSATAADRDAAFHRSASIIQRRYPGGNLDQLDNRLPLFCRPNFDEGLHQSQALNDNFGWRLIACERDRARPPRGLTFSMAGDRNKQGSKRSPPR